jgi:hypothetical protein
VKRTYLALVHGEPPAHGAIDAPIGRDTRARTRMAVHEPRQGGAHQLPGAGALRQVALLECRWKPAARTRSACTCSTSASDRGRSGLPRGARAGVDSRARPCMRPALELTHPRSGKRMSWSAPFRPT